MEYKARIKFDNREWLVIDNFEYENVKYYYIIEDASEKLNNLNNVEDYDGNFNLEFIYQVENGEYRNVTDQILINKLFAVTGGRLLKNKDNLETFQEFLKQSKNVQENSEKME